MRLDGLKNDLPETPDFIHNMIQEEVARQTKITNMVPMKKRHKYKWKMGHAAAVALICIMGTSAAAYAGTKLYYMYLEHRGNIVLPQELMWTKAQRRQSFPKK